MADNIVEVEEKDEDAKEDKNEKINVQEQKPKVYVNKEKKMNPEDMNRDQLISKVKQLEKHVFQLRNIIAKSSQDSRKEKRKEKAQRPIDFSSYNKRHVALKFLYLGWDYNGYAVQEDSEKTIEHEIFHALLKSRLVESRETSNYHRCGRTDKGVSAYTQVISIDLRSNLLDGPGVIASENGSAADRPGDKTKEIEYVHILNKILPPEIRVIGWAPVEPNFSSRFDCIRRTYKYFFPKGSLDLERMNRAASNLIGSHDFRNLCKLDVQNGVISYQRNITHAEVKMIDSADSESSGYTMCELTIIGKAFLWHQIRCIVAVLFYVAEGKEEPSIVSDLLDVTKVPSKPQYPMASELPLCLFHCEYEDVRWEYDEQCLQDTIIHMQQVWAASSIKTTMIKTMLNDISNIYHHHSIPKDTPELNEAEKNSEEIMQVDEKININSQASFVLGENKPRVHIPLLERKVSESLEDRIEHFTKKRKILIH